MPTRDKILVGAGVIWGITVCCLVISRKLSPGNIFGLIPLILHRNCKMDNDEEQKNSMEDPGPSLNHQPSSPNSPGASNNSGKQWVSNFMAGASPPKFVSLEEIVQAANGMKNMALAHEIAVDKNFQLQRLEPEENSIQKQVKEVMHKAFWNILSGQLSEDPPQYTHALVLLKEIRESLEELVLPHHTKIRDNLREVLDIDLIKQQAEKGVLDFSKYSQYVLSVMSKVCAPVRDEKIRELGECTDVVETFKGIMETIQLMKLDLANFTISMMRPNIVASSIEYEKAKFAEFLKVTTDGLQFTRLWLLKHLDEAKVQAAGADPNGVKQITHYLLAEAYLDLLNWDSSPEAETLMLDQGRLLELRDKINHLAIVGSTLLLCSNTVGAPVQGVAAFKKNVKEHLNILLDSVHSNKALAEVMPNIVLQVREDVKATLSQVGAPQLTADVESILQGQIMDLVNEDHKIRQLVNLRIRQFLQKIILSQTAVPTQVPPGLSSLQEELAAVAARFFIIVAHNRSVFGDYYQEIVATEIARRKSTLGSSDNVTDGMDA
ncbi:T-complex protein 11-like protein 1 isoform X2 [Fopius arisanus]|uniref:T-complex protein 11-like protein 1 isoform X2 n=1 Tax=Fopius arisanus TaxID=64838 RepID=A0A9R1STJ9_9HYME|nr:PREDICTED: T-complex protein 11-like protein 1 isoform X2 [Fopius arisanus]